MTASNTYSPVKVYSTSEKDGFFSALRLLDGTGIGYIVVNNNATAWYRGSAGTGSIDVIVKQVDSKRACDLLKQLIERKE